jgi:acetyltransferase-like isoleucine patch superfamily enzyme
MTAAQLQAAIDKAQRYPHKNVHKGVLTLGPDVFTTADKETNLVISPYAILDCTGSIYIGPWSNIGHRCRIYTHDTIHWGKRPLAQLEEQFGVLWQDKYIGADVWIHDGALVLYQANYLPDGFVLGAGSVLTKNPRAYEIWAGVPACKVGERKEINDEQIETQLVQNRFLLDRNQLGGQSYGA